MMDERCKLKNCLNYNDTLTEIKKESLEFLAEYICKINNTYNKLVGKIINLQQENKQLKEKVNKLEILIENLKLGVTSNQEQEDLLDKVLFGGDSDE